MPARDGTGPFGMGPIGRGLEPRICSRRRAGESWGRNARRSMRFGGAMILPSLSPEEEKVMLEQQKSWFAEALAAVTQKLEGLEKVKENE